MKTVSAMEIVKAHYIAEVKVFGSLVLVSDGFKSFSFHYSCNKIAKAVAKQISNFIGVK